jgi:hypothetical protein
VEVLTLLLVDAQVDAVDMTHLVDLMERGFSVCAIERRARDHDRHAVLITPPRRDIVNDGTDVPKELLPRAGSEKH